jgi:hypothetical protein
VFNPTSLNFLEETVDSRPVSCHAKQLKESVAGLFQYSNKGFGNNKLLTSSVTWLNEKIKMNLCIYDQKHFKLDKIAYIGLNT